MLFLAVASIGIVALAAGPTFAQSFFDPTSSAKSLVQNFYPTAQAWAFKLYTILIIFEFFALAVGAILFRDNIGEFIGGVALKVLLGSVFLYFVSNGQTFFQDVVGGFTSAGQQAGGSNNGTPAALAVDGITASALYFAAGEAAGLNDTAIANSPAGNACAGGLTFFVCLIGTSHMIAEAHRLFELVLSGVALIVLMSFVAIQLQVVLVTIESYIVMFAGVFFIGLAGSRFTMPFSQGYFNYMISVGVKLFTIYLVCGIVSQLIVPIIAYGTGAALAACCIPFGAGSFIGLGLAALGGVQAIIAAGIITAIPGYAAAFLSGQSSASASALMGQVASSMAGAALQRGQLASTRESSAQRAERSDARSMMAQTSTAGTMAPAPGSPLTAKYAEPGANDRAGTLANAGSGGNNASTTTLSADRGLLDANTYSAPPAQVTPVFVGSNNAPTQLPSSSESGTQRATPPTRELESDYARLITQSRTAEGRMQIAGALSQRQWSDLSSLQQEAFRTDPELKKIANDVAQERMGIIDDRVRQQMHAGDYAMMQGLSMAVPRDQGPPTAAQIRLSSPDRL